MIRIKHRVTGDDRFIRKANQIDDAGKFFFKLRENHVKRVSRRLSTSPPPPELPNQGYVRTGQLQRSYSYVNVNKSTWRILNRREGSAFVTDRERQARLHRGRWLTVEDEEEALRPKYIEATHRKIRRHFDN